MNAYYYMRLVQTAHTATNNSYSRVTGSIPVRSCLMLL